MSPSRRRSVLPARGLHEEEAQAPRAQTIGERGGRAVWMGALLAAAVAGVLLYA